MSHRPRRDPDVAATSPWLVLTGAGMSAESGVPTFRDAQSGLWARFKAEDLATPEAFERDPKMVWAWYQWRRQLVSQARPHAGHHLLAQLAERLGEQMLLVTQNVDALHQAAGCQRVVELHGNLMRSVCSITGETIDESWLSEHADQQPPQSPHSAAGLARPDVVWFGEALPETALREAMKAARACKTCLVIGSSGLVHPAASLPQIARQNGAYLIEINPLNTPLSALADWHIAQTASAGLRTMLAADTMWLDR